MKRAGDIVWISIPFVAGVCLGSAFGPRNSPTFNLALSACIAIVLIVSHLMEHKEQWDVPLMAVLFLILGIFCYRNALDTGPVLVPSDRTVRLMDSFASFVRSVPFGSESTGNLLAALLTGRRRWIPERTIMDFRDAGAAHILALSGLHLGVLASFLKKGLSFIGNSRTAAVTRSVAVIAASGIYAVLCGLGPSILRAFLFIAMRETASHYHTRSVPGVNILCTSCMLHLVLDPLSIGTLSFQLSYLSVASLIIVNPFVSSFFDTFRQMMTGRQDSAGVSPVASRVWRSVSVSISCQLFTAPLVWLRFGTFPKYFILTNLIALPLTELFIPLGLISTILHYFGVEFPFIFHICDLLASALTSSLRIISSM